MAAVRLCQGAEGTDRWHDLFRPRSGSQRPRCQGRRKTAVDRKREAVATARRPRRQRGSGPMRSRPPALALLPVCFFLLLSPLAAETVLIRNVDVYPVTAVPMKAVSVLIQDGKIAEIGA